LSFDLLQCGGGRGRENVAGSSRLKESKFAAKKESKSLGLVSVSRRSRRRPSRTRTRRRKGQTQILAQILANVVLRPRKSLRRRRRRRPRIQEMEKTVMTVFSAFWEFFQIPQSDCKSVVKLK
jgi:hypothetical protein